MGKEGKYRRTLVFPIHGSLETISRAAEAVSVDLSMDELEDWDEAVFALGLLHVIAWGTRPGVKPVENSNQGENPRSMGKKVGRKATLHQLPTVRETRPTLPPMS